MATPHAPSPSPWKGAVAGLVGGLVGSFVMTQFHVALHGRGVTGAREPQSHRPVDPYEERDEDATTKAADVIATATTGESLTRREKQLAGPAVHYVFGGATGALYGLLAEMKPGARAGRGLPFGLAVWVGADEIALPAMGLTEGPTAYPASVHAEMLAAHVVYGYTTDLFMRWTRRRLG